MTTTHLTTITAQTAEKQNKNTTPQNRKMKNKPIISDKFYPHGKPQINHTVLLTTHSDPETREGKVLESTTQDYKVIDHKHNKTKWMCKCTDMKEVRTI